MVVSLDAVDEMIDVMKEDKQVLWLPSISLVMVDLCVYRI